MVLSNQITRFSLPLILFALDLCQDSYNFEKMLQRKPLFANIDSSYEKQPYFLIKDENHKGLFLVIRGSYVILDWLTDASAFLFQISAEYYVGSGSSLLIQHLNISQLIPLLPNLDITKSSIISNQTISDGYNVTILLEGTNYRVKGQMMAAITPWKLYISAFYQNPYIPDFGYVHSGFYHSAQAIFNNDTLISLIEQSDLPLYIVGHSLGGSVSTILHVMFSKKYPNKDINTITFNPAPSMDNSKIEPYESKVATIRHQNDFVSKLSIYNVLKFIEDIKNDPENDNDFQIYSLFVQLGFYNLYGPDSNIFVHGTVYNIKDTSKSYLSEVIIKNNEIPPLPDPIHLNQI